ncbi:MAG: hypothetical protein M3Z24_16350 [Chloroflexota bacterium]|nr:hypothetical protein [Chloroflexota bacterium]
MLNLRAHYERISKDALPRQQLSIAQIIATHSIDTETVALIWLLLEYGASLTVAGLTEPRPGVGKTTALYALLPFLPEKMALANMAGMHETFSFTRLPDISPAETYAICSEISDHQPTYMWGQIARRYLMLPSQGYHILTTVHADTIDDVLHMYQHDLHVPLTDIRLLGLIVNIGLVGRAKASSRRWLSTYFISPQTDPQHPEAISKLPLSKWNTSNGTFEHASQSVLAQLAGWAKLTPDVFADSLQQRVELLTELAQGKGAAMDQVYETVNQWRKQNNTAVLLAAPD